MTGNQGDQSGQSDQSDQDAEGATARSRDGARRVLTVLMAFSPERHTQTARDISRATGIPLPSVYRYVALLRDMELLVADDRGNYHPSARLSVIARAAEKAETLSDIADPVMRRLSDVTGETVILVRLIARSAVCVHRIESTQSLRTSYEPGQPLSLEHGASARLLLASMPTQTRREYLAPLAARDPEAAARLEEDVLIAGERGWAVSEEEIDKGVWAAAAAVQDRSGTVAALSVPSPLVRAPEALHEELLRHVRSAAEEINAALRAAHR
jgi:DNA-binding IclR family transcriptional regulator